MSQPKRYSLVASYYCSDAKMEAFIDGEYVRHGDYAALQAENDRLKKIGFKMREMIGDHHWTLAWDRECKYSPNAAKGVQS